jgi:hypothetical protein
MPENIDGHGAVSRFVDARHNSGAWALVLLILVAVCINFISDRLTIFRLLPQQALAHQSLYSEIWAAANAVLLSAVAALWIANKTGLMRRLVLLANALFTAQLFVAVVLIVVRLAQSVKISVGHLILDAVMIFIANILVFALWYWFIDSETERSREPSVPEPWDFLFPQRQASYPGYADWTPHFVDYLFLAYTTSVAFSPTDTLPLSGVAKTLMMLQSAIALIAITAVAGTAINLLAGSA